MREPATWSCEFPGDEEYHLIPQSPMKRLATKKMHDIRAAALLQSAQNVESTSNLLLHLGEDPDVVTAKALKELSRSLRALADQPRGMKEKPRKRAPGP